MLHSIRLIEEVRNKKLIVSLPEFFDNITVEVIVRPLSNKTDYKKEKQRFLEIMEHTHAWTDDDIAEFESTIKKIKKSRMDTDE